MGTDELPLSEGVLAAVYESVDSAVLVCDTDGTIVDANPAAATLYDYTRDRLQDLGVGGLSAGDPPHTAQRVVEHLRSVAEGDPQRIAWRVAGGDGRVFPVELDLRPAARDRVVAVAREATEDSERRLERLAGQRDRLAAVNKLFRHELSNDLSVALGIAPALEPHLDDEAARHLDLLRGKHEHMSTLTDQARVVIETILDTDPEQFAVPLHQVLAEELEYLDEHEDVVLDRPEPLPGDAVTGDGRLTDAFRAVLTNAVEHNDSEPAHVTVGVETTASWVTVRVADDGPGIPDEQKETLFGRGPEWLNKPGSGLGLCLVDTVVRRHGGEVWLEDNEPRGAVVCVRLPAA